MRLRFPLLAALGLLVACSPDGPKSSGDDSGSATTPGDTGADTGDATVDPDRNGDGVLRVLVLGTSRSIESGVSFAADGVATELEALFLRDEDAPADVVVVAEDIHMTRDVTIGLGGGGTEYVYNHRSHSLLQYYYWPDGQADRFARLMNGDDHPWDYVVIGGDPFIVSRTPGYYALGAHRVAAKVTEGGGQPLLLMMWPTDGIGSTVDSFADLTSRAGAGSPVDLPVVPAGLAWDALSEDERGPSESALSPVGAAVAAATIYSHITYEHASFSGDPVGDAAHAAASEYRSRAPSDEVYAFSSPFAACGVEADLVTYNHTGSSSENGILDGLRWVFERAPQTLEPGSDPLITFNYGRANTNFEPDKRYRIDPELFSFSFGFPMQDHGNHGDTSMLYGLDYRDSGVDNDTDLGVAHTMLEQGELPHARAIPIRTLFAQMKEAMPDQSAYRDAWHMHRDLDKSIAGYMHTLVTGSCAPIAEPEDSESEDWRSWKSHRIGCETAWTFMTLSGRSPF